VVVFSVPDHRRRSVRKANEAGSSESSPRRHGITVITEPTAGELAERQISDCRVHREIFIEWVLTLGKDPGRGKGYAEATADIRRARVDKSAVLNGC